MGLEKGRRPELTCKTVGHIQDLLLPGAQQHSDHSLLISHFSYSKRKNNCQSLPQTGGTEGGREQGPPARGGGDTAGVEGGVMTVLSLPVFTATKGRSGALGTKACPRGRATVPAGDATPTPAASSEQRPIPLSRTAGSGTSCDLGLYF